MKVRVSVALVAWFLSSSLLWAQRDPPMIECYLPSISIRHADGERLSIDLVLKKETGPTEHREHQMYLLAYLREDEEEVLAIASDVSLLDKRGGSDAKLFLDVLLEKGLVTTLETKVAARQGFGGQDVTGRYADGSKAARAKERFLKFNTFAFSFEPTYTQMFDKVSRLKHFGPVDPAPDRAATDERRFKLLVYVPVNDCKYASSVRDSIRGANDFAVGEYGAGKTPILYCRPLPYELVFRRGNEVGTTVYIR